MAKDNKNEIIQRITGRVEGELKAIAHSLGFTDSELISQVGYLLFIQGPWVLDQMPGVPSQPEHPTPRIQQRAEVEVDDGSHAEVSQRRATTRAQAIVKSWTPKRRKEQAERMRQMMAAHKRKVRR
jgi:hypothetical protein